MKKKNKMPMAAPFVFTKKIYGQGCLPHPQEYFDSVDREFEGAEIQQIMPVPPDMAVMVVKFTQNDEAVFRDSRDTNWPMGLALVKTKTGQEICPIDLVEAKLELEAQLVSRHKCSKCGEEMKILLETDQEGYEAEYYCERCNRRINLESDGVENELDDDDGGENETDENRADNNQVCGNEVNDHE